jgi:hypothetical protein
MIDQYPYLHPKVAASTPLNSALEAPQGPFRSEESMFTAAVRWGIVCSLALTGAVSAQCQKGGGGGGGGPPRMAGGQPRMVGLVPRMPPGGPMLVTPPANPGLTTVPPAQRLLTTAREQQRLLTEMITRLEDVAEAPGLNPAQRRKLRSALTSAEKKLDRHEGQLMGIVARHEKGLLIAADQPRLMALTQQQQAELQALESYRQGAAEILARPGLKANQAR